MTPEILTEAIKITLQKKKVEWLAALAARDDFSVRDLIDITFHPDEQIGFRAAWILENVYTQYGERFLSYAGYFLNRFPAQENPSCRRHFSKILALMTGKKAPLPIQQLLSGYPAMDELIDTVFSWLIDDTVQVAVKSHCLTVLANLSARYEWIRDELIATIDFRMDKESIAFYAKAKQVRKQLRLNARQK